MGEKFGIIYDSSIRQGSEVLYADIYPSLVFMEFMFPRLQFRLATEYCEPLVGLISLYGQCLDSALWNSMKNDGNISYLGDIEPFIGFESEPVLRIDYAFELLLEPWETGLGSFFFLSFFESTEEMAESLAYPVAEILENLGIDNTRVSIEVFDAFIQVEFSEMLSCMCIGFNADFEKFVVGILTNIKMFEKSVSLFPAWIYSKSVVSEFHDRYFNTGFKYLLSCISPLNEGVLARFW